MRLILEFERYRMLEDIKSEISVIFPYIKIKGCYLYASSSIDRGGNPITRIDSKIPIKALFIKVENNEITIKSLINSLRDPNFSKKVIECLLRVIDKNTKIVVDQDVSGGFWDYMIGKYPEINWVKN